MTPTGDRPRRIVLTGGPGAGKTATLELVRRALPTQVRVLPESAGILFGGGFPPRVVRPRDRPEPRSRWHDGCSVTRHD